MVPRTRWLAGLCVVVGLLGVYQFFYARRIQIPSGKPPFHSSASPIQINRAEALPPASSEGAKNIFAPLPSSRIKRIEPPPPTEIPPPEIQEVHLPTPEEVALQEATAALSQIRLLGLLDRGDGRQTGFFARLSETAVAGKSDLIFGHFLVRDLSSTAAVVQETVTHAEVTLPLSGPR